MKLEDLKTGMRIILRNKREFIVLKNVVTPYRRREDMYVDINGGWISSSSYREDLTDKYGNKKWDIMEVYAQNNGEYLNGEVLGRYVIESMDKIWERNEGILDKEEKRYLKNVIRPFKNEIKTIVKRYFCQKREYIFIKTTNSTMSFPVFEEGTMYENMERNREYTLEELGL